MPSSFRRQAAAAAVAEAEVQPAGAYTITVMGTSGGATHNTPVTLVVN